MAEVLRKIDNFGGATSSLKLFTTVLQNSNTLRRFGTLRCVLRGGSLEQSLPIELAGFEAVVQTPFLLWRSIAVAERVLSGVALVLILPLLAGAALATLVLSRRSPLIAHCRVGHRRRPIWVLKLRTMWDRNSPSCEPIAIIERLTPECSDASEIKNPKDPRVTSRFAGYCRRYSIDELPQLWHVVTGEMALIGPRPLTPAGNTSTLQLCCRPTPECETRA